MKKFEKVEKTGIIASNFSLRYTPRIPMKFCYLVSKQFENHCVNTVKYKARFSPVRQDLFSKFWCPVLSGEETNMPNHQPGRTRVWHHYESDTPTSSRAIYVLKSANANDIHNVFSIGGTGVQKAQKCAYVIYG